MSVAVWKEVSIADAKAAPAGTLIHWRPDGQETAKMLVGFAEPGSVEAVALETGAVSVGGVWEIPVTADTNLKEPARKWQAAGC